MLPEIPQEELIQVLDDTACRLLRDAAITEPPVSAFDVAACQGIKIGRVGASQPRGRLVRLQTLPGGQAQPSMFIRDDPRRERRHWAVAHEIGEANAHRLFEELGVRPAEAPAGAREELANLLAGRLLLPQRWLAEQGAACDWDLIALKQVFETASHEMIARRMLEFSGSMIVTIFDHAEVTFRRATHGSRALPLCDAERQAQKESHRSGKSRETWQTDCRIRVWPIHENDWKREIMRLDMPDQSEF